jgi:hypothetical protein
MSVVARFLPQFPATSTASTSYCPPPLENYIKTNNNLKMEKCGKEELFEYGN